MVMETYKELDSIKTELDYVCGYLFKNPPIVTIEDSEDAPCVVLDGSISICYYSHRNYTKYIYEIQKVVTEHNYPHEPDWMDYVAIEICKNKYAAIAKVIDIWVSETLNTEWENRGYEEMASEIQEGLSS